MSLEIVPTRIMSRSSGRMCARFKASSDAFVQRSENFSPSDTMWRSLIPVRDVIHSSDVLTSFSRSAFVRSFFGTAAPVPTIRARFTPRPGPKCAGIRPAPRSLGTLRLDEGRFARVELGYRRLDLLREPLLRELRGETDGVLDGLRARTPVADDHATLDPEHRGPA